ncbi:MAG: acyl-[ACP]--phospholipid O-acyltransferase [Gammaproteobacteria bacterium]|nr:acyl-[ACP]--phospholipid O-acyltransferase [Gammaproteobacteria bacterium]
MRILFRLAGFTPYVLMVFINAFVDLGHKIIIQNTVFKIYDGQTQIILTAIVNGLILLPFVLLFSPSGFVSDKYPKNRIMRISAWLAIAMTSLITLFYYAGWFWSAFAMTFFLAVQSALYSPAKYGYIKALAGKKCLATANAAVQATTTTAILAGVFIFSIIFEWALAGVAYSSEVQLLQAIAPIGWVLVGCSIIELLLAYRLPEKGPTKGDLQFDLVPYLKGHYLRNNLGKIFSSQIIWLSIIGLSVFWGISQVLLASYPAFAKEILQETNTVVIQGTLACAGIGIMFGSILAGKASANHIETGLIPLGAVGVVITLFLMTQIESVVLLGFNFMVLGVLGGLFIIPLNALIQFHARDDQLGTVLAGNNWIQNITMLLFLGLTVMFALVGISSIGLFYLLTLIALIGAVYTVYRLPQSLVRYIASLIIARKYRIEILGFNNIPERGAVLMLGNHISWIDWAIVQIACPRPIRFVMQREIYERWYLKWFLNFFGVVPIGSGRSKAALQQVNDLLKAREVVCLFPEGAISRNGHLGEFRRGYERVVDQVNGVILPFYLRGLWGTWFSRSSAKLRFSRKRGTKRDIIVAFGKPLPMDTPAPELKKKVFELSIRAWDRYTHTLDSIPLEWCRTVKRLSSATGVVDSRGEPFSNAKTLTVAIAFSRLIRRYSPEQNIGLLLPTSSVGIIVNMATLMGGKTVVNLNYTVNLQALQSAVVKAEIQSIYTSRRFVDKLQKRGVDLRPLLAVVKVYFLEDLKDEIANAAKLGILIFVKCLPAWLLYTLLCRNTPIENPAAILFSSGSEGEPKGIVLSHKNIMGNIKQVSDVLNTQADDVVMGSLPLFHAFGMTVTGFMPLIEGVPLVCHPDPTDAVNVAKAIAKYRATVFCGTSTILRLYTKNRRIVPPMLESLRVVVAGAEKLNNDVREAFKFKFNKDIYEGYGATETTPVACVNIPDQIDITYWRLQAGQKLGTVGMPLPGTGLRIVNPETLEDLPTGEDGLILIGGTQVMIGYLKDPEKTADVLVEIDGIEWYKTGDKGHVDEDGFLTIVDRYSRFAKIGGEMISLSAVEGQVRQVLNDSELEMVVVGLPDGKKGEKISLLITGNGETDGLRKQLIAAKCSPLMIPAEIYSVKELPKLGSGKTDFKAAVKMATELGAGII